jgi:hypothetical protein
MTSTQDMVRPGEPVDLYYYDGETSRKQAFPTTVNTKFVQNFQTLTGGSSTFTIPPSNGIQDIVCQFQLTVGTTNANTAIPSGWGYALIKQVSFRYGGSSQYFLTGDQLLQLAMMKQATTTAMNDIVNLGGNAQLTVTAGKLYANCVLTLPHSTPSGVGKALPFPTDLLTQQVQVTVELYPVSAVLTGSGIATANISLSNAQFCVQQIMLNNQADALARRVDMSVNAYAFPGQFVQQKQTINLGAGTSANCGQYQSQAGIPVTLTGFRSGEVKAIAVWLSLSSDYNPNTAGNITCAPFNWYLPTSAQMTYAGDVYARFDNQGSVLWNLVNDNKSPAVSTVGYNAGTPPTQNQISSAYGAGLCSWVVLPFAQTFVDEDEHHVLVHGKPITNGIVNLLISPPAVASDLVGGATWILNVSYIYNTTLLMSQGSADFVF